MMEVEGLGEQLKGPQVHASPLSCLDPGDRRLRDTRASRQRSLGEFGAFPKVRQPEREGGHVGKLSP